MFGSNAFKKKVFGEAPQSLESSPQLEARSKHMETDKTVTASPVVSSIIAEGVLFEGSLHSSSHIFIHEEIVGEVNAPTVNFGKSGVMSGKLRCRTASIDGAFDGELVCDEVVLGALSKVHGNVSCRSLRVAKGALITGEISVEDGIDV